MSLRRPFITELVKAGRSPVRTFGAAVAGRSSDGRAPLPDVLVRRTPIAEVIVAKSMAPTSVFTVEFQISRKTAAVSRIGPRPPPIPFHDIPGIGFAPTAEFHGAFSPRRKNFSGEVSAILHDSPLTIWMVKMERAKYQPCSHRGKMGLCIASLPGKSCQRPQTLTG